MAMASGPWNPSVPTGSTAALAPVRAFSAVTELPRTLVTHTRLPVAATALGPLSRSFAPSYTLATTAVAVVGRTGPLLRPASPGQRAPRAAAAGSERFRNVPELGPLTH